MELANVKFVENENGLYVSAIYRGVTYGESYETKDELFAIDKLSKLIKTYIDKGDWYVMRYGSAY